MSTIKCFLTFVACSKFKSLLCMFGSNSFKTKLYYTIDMKLDMIDRNSDSEFVPMNI